MKRTHRGGCHCGAVRYEADFDLNAGTFKCNCPICTKKRMWGAIVEPESFRLLSGEADLVDYRPDHVHHLFCRHCGIHSFGRGTLETGGQFYAVCVATLEDTNIDELVGAPITHFDGLHDNFQSHPAEIRHL
jgi:hypothetical protein